ncbi:MAG: S9 family peptidase [Sphingomonadales bacterium]|jgi:dipeptidyl-peptidase-4
MKTLGRMSLFSFLIATMGANPLMSSAAQDEVQNLTIERLFADPDLNGPRPARLTFSPDGQVAAFLKGKEDDAQQLDLWSYDVASGETKLLVDSRALEPADFELSEEEKARRERQRIRSRGIVEFSWGPTASSLLIPLAGDLFHVGLGEDSPQIRQLTKSDAFETDSRLSPLGTYASFIRDGALWTVDIDSGKEKRISPKAKDATKYGVAEFVAQEEMGRNTGYWWAPDESHIAYTEVDESAVDIVQRFDINADGVTVIEQRYPRAGTTNATVNLIVQDLKNKRKFRVDLGEEEDIYLARVNWLPDGSGLLVQRQSRNQRVLDLIHVDLKSKKSNVILSESADTYVNLHFDLRVLKDSSGFIWSSERSGYRHLELHAMDGSLVREITSGDWAVEAVKRVDEVRGLIFFTGYKDTPLERHLYEVSFQSPQTPKRLTKAGMTHVVDVAAGGKAFIATSSSPAQPPQVGLYDGQGQLLRWIEENRLDENHPYFPYVSKHVTPEFGTIDNGQGTTLYYELLKPHNMEEGHKYPAIVHVYNGPHVQYVTNSWGDLLDQVYLQRGYVVFRIDGRGSNNRGKAFEEALYEKMGSVEVEDQYAGLAFLKTLDFVDPDRIGVRGWSYGGYMTLNLMLQKPGAYAAGAAGAPVTDWKFYDTHYTERYMNLPADNEDGYKSSSVLPIAGNLKKPLLMIHGMADDNVIFDNSTAVYSYFQENNIPFEMMTYPGQKHGIAGNKRRMHVNNTMLDFFDRHLKN